MPRFRVEGLGFRGRILSLSSFEAKIVRRTADQLRPAGVPPDRGERGGRILFGKLVKGLQLSYHSKETMLFTIDPYFGHLK